MRCMDTAYVRDKPSPKIAGCRVQDSCISGNLETFGEIIPYHPWIGIFTHIWLDFWWFSCRLHIPFVLHGSVMGGPHQPKWLCWAWISASSWWCSLLGSECQRSCWGKPTYYGILKVRSQCPRRGILIFPIISYHSLRFQTTKTLRLAKKKSAFCLEKNIP